MVGEQVEGFPRLGVANEATRRHGLAEMQMVPFCGWAHGAVVSEQLIRVGFWVSIFRFSLQKGGNSTKLSISQSSHLL